MKKTDNLLEDYTVDSQMFGQKNHEKSHTKPLIIEKNDRYTKLFVLNLIHQTSRDYIKRNDDQSSKYLAIEIAVTAILITGVITLIAAFIAIPEIDTFRIFAGLATLVVLEVTMILWTKTKQKNLRYEDIQTFYAPRIDLLYKLSEKWHVYIDSADHSPYTFLVQIQTESEIAKLNKNKSEYRSHILSQVKDLKNQIPIKEIFQNKEKFHKRTLHLMTYLEQYASFQMKNGYTNFYKIYDKTGYATLIQIVTKKHFWEKAPKLENDYNKLSDGVYNIAAIFGGFKRGSALFLIGFKKMKAGDMDIPKRK